MTDPVATAMELLAALAAGEDTDVIEGQLDRDEALQVAVALAGHLFAAWQQMGLDPLQAARGILAHHRAAQN
jgi:hypothetical protein